MEEHSEERFYRLLLEVTRIPFTQFLLVRTQSHGHS